VNVGSGQSIEFAQFLPELAEAIIPLCISVHFFSAPVSEQSGRAFQPFGLLVKKDAHLGGYLLHPMVVHSRSMQLLMVRVSPIVNTNAEDRRGVPTWGVPHSGRGGFLLHNDHSCRTIAISGFTMCLSSTLEGELLKLASQDSTRSLGRFCL
jgi:hypothetical protein